MHSPQPSSSPCSHLWIHFRFLPAGAKIFKTKCAQCHVAEAGGGHKQVRSLFVYVTQDDTTREGRHSKKARGRHGHGHRSADAKRNANPLDRFQGALQCFHCSVFQAKTFFIFSIFSCRTHPDPSPSTPPPTRAPTWAAFSAASAAQRRGSRTAPRTKTKASSGEPTPFTTTC